MADASQSPSRPNPIPTAAGESPRADTGGGADLNVDDEEVEDSINRNPDEIMQDAPPISSSSENNHNATQDTNATQPLSSDGANDSMPSSSSQQPGATSAQQPQQTHPSAPTIAELEARIPQKKDATLREFLGKMDDYAPVIPDAVTNYYLTLAGLPPPPQTPLPIARLLALATQKFISDIAADSYQYARIRSSNTTSNTAAAAMSMPGSGGMAGTMASANAAAAAAVAAGGLGAPGGVAATGKEGEKAGPGGKAVTLGMQRPGYGGGGQGTTHGRTVLTMEDLGMAAGEYGVNVKRGEFYR